MGFFKQVEGEAAVLIRNGIYRQCDVYERDNYLYAKVSGGFVRLYADGSTTNIKTRLDIISWTDPIARDATGRRCRPDIPGSVALEAPKKQLLLGAPAE